MPHPMTRQSPAPAREVGFGADLTNAPARAERDSPATPDVGDPARTARHSAAIRPAPGPSAGEPPGGLAGPPAQPFLDLDALWIQVAGTLCNLACTHCFVTCGPREARHAMMSRADVAARVSEALALGVREFYLTGGEPFLHPELEAIVEDTLAHAPVTILTNGTLFTSARLAWLARLSRSARHSLELRVSLDAADERGHEAFRGAGTWARTMRGLRALEAGGLAPIVTLTRPAGVDEAELAARARAALAAEGVRGARLKTLPLFPLGRERARNGPAPRPRSLAALPPGAFDPERLQCGRARAVTSRGVYVCPLLVDEPGGRMADTLAAAARPFALAHDACVTCWATGMTCANG
jgi:sulfatase maturation enzyme AslB (radical SAM superfamily)